MIYRTSLAVAFVVIFVGNAVSAERPNLLLFMADDMTYTDVGCFGNADVKTSNIDRLASEGVRFTRCYNAAPTCSPLRQSLMTGIYPVRNGAHPNHSRVYDGVRSLPHYLEPLGYRTAIVGKRHEAPAAAFPFEMLGGSHGDGGKTPDGADLPLEKAREFMTRDRSQPWCLFVTSNQPHTPWNRGDASAYPPSSLRVPPYLVDTPELRNGLSKYYAEITYMDGQVGQVLNDLDEFGLADNTVVLWLSEQGSQLPFGKWTCYEMGIHAAAVLRWPEVVTKGSTTKALISYVDIVPTFVELAGGDPTQLDVDGKSFARLLDGRASSHNDIIFSTNTTRGIYHGSEAFATRSATDGRWLYIRNLHSDAEFQNSVTHRGPIYASWKHVETDFAQSRVRAYVKRPAEELFDLQHDPWCLTNLSGSTGNAAIESELSSRMDGWMKQQGDGGDSTERAALERQPQDKPWAKKAGNSYALSQTVAELSSGNSAEQPVQDGGARAAPARVGNTNRVATPPPTKPPLTPVDITKLPDGTDRLDLYLLMGQSNMKGRGVMPDEPLSDPRIVMMHRKTDEWFLARHPLHLVGDPRDFKGHDNAGVGPGLSFAQTIAARHANARIGLIPCAVGGTPISRWARDQKLYDDAIRKAKLALQQGPKGKTFLRGAIWLQGEADSRPDRLPKYRAVLNDLVDRLRADLGQTEFPFIASTIGEMRADTPESQRSKVNVILLDLPNQRPHTSCVDARDLKGHIGDTVHFDTAAQEEIGRRFAEEYLKLMAEY